MNPQSAIIRHTGLSHLPVTVVCYCSQEESKIFQNLNQLCTAVNSRSGLSFPSFSVPLGNAFSACRKRVATVFKHNQQDATLHNGIYYCKCSTCFMRFLRPSSGAQNSIRSTGYLSSFYCFLSLAQASSKKQ
jgi:hypothetical protein